MTGDYCLNKQHLMWIGIPMMRTRTFTVVTMGFAAILLIAGCSAPPEATPDAPPPSASSSASSPAATETEPPGDAPVPSSPGAYLDYADGVIAATEGSKALFFHASWCPQCRSLDEDLHASGAPDGLTVFKVDYDERTDLRQQYGVTLQTTIVFVDDSGDAISSIVLYDEPTVESLAAAIP